MPSNLILNKVIIKNELGSKISKIFTKISTIEIKNYLVKLLIHETQNPGYVLFYFIFLLEIVILKIVWAKQQPLLCQKKDRNRNRKLI